MLKVSMVQETELFFDEVLKNDLSLTNFVASDFTMLNGRLAKHYGIPGVDGLGVPQGDAAAGQPPRRRADDGERAEGDGQRHHHLAGPARRVGAGPHPRHAAAAAARRTCRPSSRTSAAPRRSASNSPSTGRSPSCASCHAKIDPPGFALESFDVIGGWRDYYRSIGNGKPVDRGRPADAVPARARRWTPPTCCRTARRFANIDEFKQLLLKDKDQLARALAEKLLTYATGAAPADGRPGRDRGDRRARSARRTTASGRWSTRSCRASCFRHK